MIFFFSGFSTHHIGTVLRIPTPQYLGALIFLWSILLSHCFRCFRSALHVARCCQLDFFFLFHNLFVLVTYVSRFWSSDRSPSVFSVERVASERSTYQKSFNHVIEHRTHQPKGRERTTGSGSSSKLPTTPSLILQLQPCVR